MENRIPLAVIAGPTASGKTAAGVRVAQLLGGEVISADSMQIYKHLTVGTAKPLVQEMQGVPHHLIDFLEPSESFSVADYVRLARQQIEQVHQRGHLPVLVGGTGLYISSLVDNIQFSQEDGDPQLRKHCHEVKDFNPRLHMLLDDMRQTLAESNGVGLAAPQIGVLRRAVIVLETNVPDGEEEYMIELINPTIVETAGEQTGAEGCLSIPNEFGIVQRPDYVKVRAQDRHGEWFEVEGRGLTARAFCHEIDHLDGVLFIDKAIRMLSPEELEQQAKG